MYFNGEPFGDHTTPHARKLPWEKSPRRGHQVRDVDWQVLDSLSRTPLSPTGKPTSTEFRKPYGADRDQPAHGPLAAPALRGAPRTVRPLQPSYRRPLPPPWFLFGAPAQ